MQSAGQLTLAYEALRAQATGELPAVTPRGLAVFLAEGFPTWIGTWNTVVMTAPSAESAPRNQPAAVGVRSEMVQLLAEMAWRCQTGRKK